MTERDKHYKWQHAQQLSCGAQVKERAWLAHRDACLEDLFRRKSFRRMQNLLARAKMQKPFRGKVKFFKPNGKCRALCDAAIDLLASPCRSGADS